MKTAEWQTAMRTRVQSELVTNHGYVVVAPNVIMDLPPAPYVEYHINSGRPEKKTTGAAINRFETPGFLTFQIYVSKGSGTGLAVEMSENIEESFFDVKADGIEYGMPTITNVGALAGGLYLVNVQCPFRVTKYA